MVKYPVLHAIYSRLYRRAPEPELAPTADGAGIAPARSRLFDGEKYAGGFGFTELLTADYWTLRARSTQLFKQNLYARGIIRRLVRNIINTGLALEATPDEQILGIPEDTIADWAESVENRFHLWERLPELCDHKGQEAFGALQASAKMTALISGDVLVVLIQDPGTSLPRVRLVDGSKVQSPLGTSPPALAAGNTIRHGVELDPDGRHVAYWVLQESDEPLGPRKLARLPARGPTGRRLAWLVYGTEKLLDEVRGEPLLAIILQSLKEIDRYRDAVQRKAAVNAIVAMFIKKEKPGPSSRALSAGGAQVRGKAVATGGPGTTPRAFNFSEMYPGVVLDELAEGESPQGFSSTGTDEKFSDFEAAIVYAIAWALEIPPEILTLSFQSNYSASQAAINEFKLYLNPVRASWGDDFCQPIYVDWLLSELLAGRIVANGLLEAWRDPSKYDRYAAWIMADWSGAIKPSVDLVKQANGYALLVAQGFISRDRATRETTGTKYSKNVAKLRRENLQLAEANKPLAPPEPAPAPAADAGKRPASPVRKVANATLSLVESDDDE